MPFSSSVALIIALAVAVVIILVLLIRTSGQKKKTEQAAAKILSMSENMITLSSVPLSRSEVAGYKLEEKLSEGVGFITFRGTNEHHEACDIKVPTTSALEDKTTLARMEREASVLETVNSPNVVRFKAFEKVKDRGRIVPMLVTEPLDGEDLSMALKRVGTMPAQEVVSILLDMANALAAIHRRQVVHRNVKPHSINVTSGKRAVLHNFGVAQADDTQQLTQRGDVLGTGLYMSPEQITGKELDARSDLYSLGVVAYEMLTGKPPHAGVAYGELVMRKMSSDVPHPASVVSDIPTELDELVVHLMQKDVDKRPASASALITSLQALQTRAAAGETTDARPS